MCDSIGETKTKELILDFECNINRDNGFVHFGNRNLDKDERENNSGEYLLQMLRDLSNYE